MRVLLPCAVLLCALAAACGAGNPGTFGQPCAAAPPAGAKAAPCSAGFTCDATLQVCVTAPTGDCVALDAPVVVLERGGSACVDLAALCGAPPCALSGAALAGDVRVRLRDGARVDVAAVGTADTVGVDRVDVPLLVNGAAAALRVFVVDGLDYDRRFADVHDGGTRWTGGGDGDAGFVLPPGVDDRAFIPAVAAPGQLMELAAVTQALLVDTRADVGLRTLASSSVTCDALISGPLGRLVSLDVAARCPLGGPTRVGGEVRTFTASQGAQVRVDGTFAVGEELAVLDTAVLDVGDGALVALRDLDVDAAAGLVMEDPAATLEVHGDLALCESFEEVPEHTLSVLRAGRVVLHGSGYFIAPDLVVGDGMALQLVSDGAVQECLSVLGALPHVVVGPQGDYLFDTNFEIAGPVYEAVITRAALIEGSLSLPFDQVVTVADGAVVTVAARGRLLVEADGVVRVRAGGTLRVEPDGALILDGRLEVDDGGCVEIGGSCAGATCPAPAVCP